MTWNTPLGHRTLKGTERTLISAAICRMTRETIEDSVDDELNVGVGVFDSMSGCQQLVMLHYVRHHLFFETDWPNEMTAVVEGTAGAIIAYIRGQVDYELDIEKDIAKGDTLLEANRFFRVLLLKAANEYEWEVDTIDGANDWEFLVELLHDRILHDEDYDMDFADGSPEASRAVNETLGIFEDYFTGVPLAEPDGPEMLEVIRRLLR